MAGQLQGVSQLPGLGSLSRLNIPAAYAGDQRSLQAVQRGINEAETGLQSPGRRKLLKQGAATALRSAIPDTMVEGLGANVLKKVAGDVLTPEIPIESVQAAISQALDKVLSHKGWAGLIQDGVYPSELMSHFKDGVTKEALLNAMDDESITLTPKRAQSLIDAYYQLTPEAIAKNSGLPVEAIQKHFSTSNFPDAESLLDGITGEQSMHDAFMDSTDKHQFHDSGYDEFASHIPEEELKKAAEEERAIDVESPEYDGHSPLAALHYSSHITAAGKPYRDMLGDTGYANMIKRVGVDPEALATWRLDYLHENNERLHDWFTELPDVLLGKK